MQKDLMKNGFYLYLRKPARHQLQQSAKRHQRTVVKEATTILQETLLPGYVNTVEELSRTEKSNGNGLYLELSEELLARLRPLAEKNYRSLAAQMTHVLETVLSLAEREADTAITKIEPILGLGKRPRTRKLAL